MMEKMFEGVFYCCEKIYEQENDIMDIDDLKEINVGIFIYLGIFKLKEIMKKKIMDIKWVI